MERMKIMVVDDEPFIREMMEEFLSLQGHDVVSAGSGEEAIATIAENDPDMALLDIWMPGISGIETLVRIKEISPGVGIVMLSAFGDEETVNEALDMGADFYLQKPIEFKRLIMIIREWQLSEKRKR
jgi:two-component system, NtrC family, nitrogen regulation response regulator NtrX